nr:MAG TPA: hypothetical protein [Microviridae sp.]
MVTWFPSTLTRFFPATLSRSVLLRSFVCRRF